MVLSESKNEPESYLKKIEIDGRVFEAMFNQTWSDLLDVVFKFRSLNLKLVNELERSLLIISFVH